MKKILSLLVPMILGLGAVLVPAVAFAQEAPAPAAAYGGSNVLIPGLEAVNMLLAAICIVIIVLVIRQFGSSTLSVIFGYFLIGTSLLGLARLFILLSSVGIIRTSDDTIMLGWHLLFYLAMITFFIAGRGFSRLGADSQATETFSRVLGWGMVCAVAALVIFVLGPGADKQVAALFTGSAADYSGAVHFVALSLGGIAAFYLFRKAKLGQITAMLALPYLVSFGLFALNHVWEILVESWKVIDVTSSTGERVEQIFVLPAFLLIAYAYIRLWTILRPRA